MNDHELSTHDAEIVQDSQSNPSYRALTVLEYCALFGVDEPLSENTVRSRIRRGMLDTFTHDGNGRSTLFIRVPEHEAQWAERRKHGKAKSQDSASPVHDEFIALKAENDQLRKELEAERIQNARLATKLESFDIILASKDETIESHRKAYEALNNEREGFTRQLQKYREPEPTIQPFSKAWWRFWKL